MNLDSKIEWSHRILQDVSRTFAIPIERIDQPLSNYVCAGYLLCRIPDTIEDSPNIDVEHKNEFFNAYKEALQSGKSTDTDRVIQIIEDIRPSNPYEEDHWNLVDRTDDVLEIFSSFPEDTRNGIREPVLELVEGMRIFCNRYENGVRIQTVDELKEYCYYVAGTVGHLLANITSTYPDGMEDEIHERAEKYGLLLQMVNIVKDVHDDYGDENNVYVPSKLLKRYGVEEQHKLLAEENIEGTEMAMVELIEEARVYIDDARSYVTGVTKSDTSNLTSWAIPYLLAIATLRELENNTSEALTEGGVKMSKEEVFAVISSLEDADVDEFRKLEEKISRDSLV